MTQAEHAAEIRRTLRNLHRALDLHHRTLAAYAAEYGEAAGIDPALLALAVAPKDPPPNDPGE